MVCHALDKLFSGQEPLQRFLRLQSQQNTVKSIFLLTKLLANWVCVDEFAVPLIEVTSVVLEFLPTKEFVHPRSFFNSG